MFKGLIAEARQMLEAGGFRLQDVPSAHLKHAADTFKSDAEQPSVLARVLKRKGPERSGGEMGISRGATLLKRKASPPPIPSASKPAAPSSDVKDAMSSLPKHTQSFHTTSQGKNYRVRRVESKLIADLRNLLK